MMRRYGVTAVFNDPDFEMNAPVKKYWSRVSANHEWWQREQLRRGVEDKWRWVVIDLRTGEDITPKI